MSIKPCPACGSDNIGRASLEYSLKHKRVCDCGVQGPWANSPAEADAAWNTMPRGDVGGEVSIPSGEGIEFWAESKLRDALEDDENIDMALFSLKVGHGRGDSARVVMRAVLAGFCLEALGLKVTRDESGIRLRAEKEAAK